MLANAEEAELAARQVEAAKKGFYGTGSGWQPLGDGGGGGVDDRRGASAGPRPGRHDSDSDDAEPARRRARHDSDSDAEPVRRRPRHDSDGDAEPARRQPAARDSDGDAEPTRRPGQRHDSDSDAEPPRRAGSRHRPAEDDDDAEPQRRRARVRHDSDDDDVDPPRRRRGGDDSDASPPRPKRGRPAGGGADDDDLSPPRKRSAAPREQPASVRWALWHPAVPGLTCTFTVCAASTGTCQDLSDVRETPGDGADSVHCRLSKPASVPGTLSCYQTLRDATQATRAHHDGRHGHGHDHGGPAEGGTRPQARRRPRAVFAPGRRHHRPRGADGARGGHHSALLTLTSTTAWS